MSPTRTALSWSLRQRDPLLALGFCAFGELELFSGAQYQGRPVWTGPLPVLVLVVALLTLPLAWRRSRPMTASLTIFAVLTASSLAFEGSESTVVFLATLVTIPPGTAFVHNSLWERHSVGLYVSGSLPPASVLKSNEVSISILHRLLLPLPLPSARAAGQRLRAPAGMRTPHLRRSP